MSGATPGADAAEPSRETAVGQTPTPKDKQEQERPPQQEELLCTICHMPSCWR
jgi:hypothetical protein